MKNMLLMTAVVAALALGTYSLFLASVNAGKVRLSSAAGFVRTATAADTEKITLASGEYTGQDLVYVLLYSTNTVPDPEMEHTVRRTARILSDSGTAAAVRILSPRNPDFTMIVAQNDVVRFPAVLAVNKVDGIVQVTDEISEKNLIHAYYGISGKTSSCDDAKSAVY